jgi:transposase
MRKQYSVRLSEAERAALRTLLGRGDAPARVQAHARIRLTANQGDAGPGWTDDAISTALEVDRTTVSRIRKRYVTAGLAAALHRKAPERVYRRQLDGEQEARLVAVACSEPPSGQQRWTLRLLANRLVEVEVVEAISYETVRQTLKPTG